jgi:uncharacterized protein (DUF4415 family)
VLTVGEASRERIATNSPIAVKQQIALRLDADLINWFKTNPVNNEGYQTSIKRALREYARRATGYGSHHNPEWNSPLWW